MNTDNNNNKFRSLECFVKVNKYFILSDNKLRFA